MLRYLCFLAVLFSAKCALAPFIKPCKAGDNACLLASSRAAVPILAPGIPELGIKPLDPMKLALVKGDQGALQLTFTNSELTGMKGCSVDSVKHNIAKGKNTNLIRCTVHLQGDYKLGGRLLVFPISGEGKYNIDIQDIVIKTVSNLEVVKGADGKNHWHIKDWKHSFEVKTGTQFHFDNLFNGNTILANTVESFMNSNWRDVMKEVASPIVSSIVSNVVDAVEALYKAVPADELELS